MMREYSARAFSVKTPFTSSARMISWRTARSSAAGSSVGYAPGGEGPGVDRALHGVFRAEQADPLMAVTAA